ncbi:hypothetical protein [Nocardia asteroides]|uniref:hypothetical protein n=1 Tax=Nocardia asteroides TaxID=1824 RepID=UPI001E3105DD|nr:hypothetical protein [Nocardia asteroides]UGT62456.1 hypothetical protein LTT61_03670 [Nocardia asteroides]
MTGYSSDPAQVLGSVVEALTNRVLPEVPDGPARLELGAVLEVLGNLVGRVGWDGARLGAVCARTEQLAREVGLPSAELPPTVAALRERRAEIADVLAVAYDPDRSPSTSGTAVAPASSHADTATIAAAVAAFTADDVADQITGALRGAFAPTGDPR